MNSAPSNLGLNQFSSVTDPLNSNISINPLNSPSNNSDSLSNSDDQSYKNSDIRSNSVNNINPPILNTNPTNLFSSNSAENVFLSNSDSSNNFPSVSLGVLSSNISVHQDANSINSFDSISSSSNIRSSNSLRGTTPRVIKENAEKLRIINKPFPINNRILSSGNDSSGRISNKNAKNSPGQITLSINGLCPIYQCDGSSSSNELHQEKPYQCDDSSSSNELHQEKPYQCDDSSSSNELHQEKPYQCDDSSSSNELHKEKPYQCDDSSSSTPGLPQEKPYQYDDSSSNTSRLSQEKLHHSSNSSDIEPGYPLITNGEPTRPGLFDNILETTKPLFLQPTPTILESKDSFNKNYDPTLLANVSTIPYNSSCKILPFEASCFQYSDIPRFQDLSETRNKSPMHIKLIRSKEEPNFELVINYLDTIILSDTIVRPKSKFFKYTEEEHIKNTCRVYLETIFPDAIYDIIL